MRFFEHSAEEDAEESLCHDATVLHGDGDEKWPLKVVVENYVAALVLVLLDHHLLEIGRTAK